MKTFKQFTSEQKDISQPLIGFCSAGGPPNQRSILEALRTRRTPDVYNHVVHFWDAHIGH